MSLEVNKRITECREKAKMTKKELAQRLGIKYTTYCRKEEKAKRITIDEIERIAKELGADKDYILYGKREEYDFSPLEPCIVVAETPNRGASPFDTPEKPIIGYKDGEFACTCEERALVLMYRSLSWENKQKASQFIESLNK